MKFKVTEVLLNYGMPLVVRAKNEKGGEFIGVNYHDPEDGSPYSFYFVRPRPKILSEFLDQKIDLRYLITHGSYKAKYEASTWADVDEDFVAKTYEEVIPEDMLPEPRLFNPTPTPRSSAVDKRKILIDGRWDVADLSLFSDLVRDTYSFAYALTKSKVSLTLKSIFERYPWRGGSSSLAFFNSLSDFIKKDESVKVTKMQYASPGFLEFSLRSDVADLIKSLVIDINSNESSAGRAYDEARSYLRDKDWLTQSEEDIPDLTPEQIAEVEKIMSDLCEGLGLVDFKTHIFELSANNHLAGVKILLAFYRRLKKFADYSATGKAVEIFAA